jgi:hypothetical protein
VLVENTSFRKLCLDTLASLPSPDVVIVPEHSTSEPIRELLNEAFAIRKPLLLNARGGVIEDIAPIHDSDQVLIADDAVVSGQTVRGLKHQLYRACRSRGRVPRVDCFVLLARPRSRELGRAVRLPYYDDDGSHLHAVWTLYLPDGASCPWCHERNLLLDLRRHVANADEYLRFRVQHLETGVEPPVLLGSDKVPAANERTVRSFFGDLDEKTAFAAASSIACELTLQADEPAQPFTREVVDLAFILEAFFDAALLSGFLRTVSRSALMSWTQTGRVASVLQSFPADRCVPGIVEEIAWAAINKKISPDVVKALMDRVPDPTPGHRMLRSLLDRM